MAKNKNDADFFPFYAKQGKTLFLLQDEFGLEGIGFFTNLMRLLTITPDHHLNIQEESDRLYVFRQIGVNEKQGSAILKMMARTGKIDAELLSHGIIASQDFLDSLAPLYERRKGKCISIEDIRATYCIQDNDSRTDDVDIITPESQSCSHDDDIMSTSCIHNDNMMPTKSDKVKQSRVKESKAVAYKRDNSYKQEDQVVENSPTHAATAAFSVSQIKKTIPWELNPSILEKILRKLKEEDVGIEFIPWIVEKAQKQKSPTGWFIKASTEWTDKFQDFRKHLEEKSRQKDEEERQEHLDKRRQCPKCGTPMQMFEAGMEGHCHDCRTIYEWIKEDWQLVTQEPVPSSVSDIIGLSPEERTFSDDELSDLQNF